MARPEIFGDTERSLMSLIDLPKYTGLVLFLLLWGSYGLWKRIHWDDSPGRRGQSDRNSED
jgi:hypothetical protein